VWTQWLGLGHANVDVFMVLSGFCLMLPVVRGDGTLRGGTRAFFKKRARRILPPYYSALALSLFFIWTVAGRPTNTLWDISLPVTARGVIVHLLLLQDFTAKYISQINYALWSISLEWWIYFLFPALVLAWNRFGGGVTTAFSVAGTWLLCRTLDHFLAQSFTLQYIALFVFGMLGAEIVHGHRTPLRFLRDRLPWEAVTWIAAGLALLAFQGKIPYFVLTERSDLLIGFWAMCLLITLGLRPSLRLARTLSQKSAVFLGSFAYSIYLIHPPLVQLIWQSGLRPLHLAPVPAFLLLVLGGTPLIVAAAYLFHLAFERPFMTKSGVKIKTEAQAESVAVVNPAP
jgi:peptidoglycan/LPS O-acetylase OafA/YrhL